MRERMGILISCFDYSPVAEDEFHDWYDTEHIPERARIPGFVQCSRWLGLDAPKVSVTTYDLADVDILRSSGYLAVGYDNNSPWTRRVGWRCNKLLRFEGEQVTPGNRLPPERACALLVMAENVAPAFEAELERWYDEALLPALAGVPGVACVRRFRATNSTHRHVLTCHLNRSDVTASAAWRQALQPTPARIEPQLRDRWHTLAAAYSRAATRGG